MPTLLYVGCLGYSNLGDEACLAGFESLMSGFLPADWKLSVVNGYDFSGDEPFDALVLGGGTLLSPHGNLGDPALREARRRGTPYHIFGTGLESEAWENLPPEPQVAEFRDLVGGAASIALRGDQSKKYLTQIGVPSDRMAVVGDLAVGLATPPRRRDGSGRRLGVNIGTSFGRVYGRDESKMVDTLVAAIAALADEIDEVVFIPVWDRDLPTQREVVRRMPSSLSTVEIDKLPTIDGLLGHLGSVDTLIAMKLHAGILAAVAGTPYVPWAYRPKVEDFATEIGMQEFVVRTDAPAATLTEAWRRLAGNGSRIRAALAQATEAMRGRLRQGARELADRLQPPL